MSCLCGSELPETACCGPYLSGDALPPTAEALMRSRYSAYASGAYDYLIATHDPDTCKTDAASLAAASKRTTWLGLRVDRCEDGGVDDETGRVTFTASFFDGRQRGELRERSRFRRIDGRWFYVDGTLPLAAWRAPPPPRSAGRNAPCGCGSGRKFKRCCGRGAG